MAQVAVNIAGRTYRMACEDGEEPHLEELAREFDGKITQMRGAFGEIGDQRLMVMAAISLADERSEARRKAALLENELAQLRDSSGRAHADVEEIASQVSRAVDEAAGRIERIVRRMEGA
jgi:cell division protein ZapA